ncbi:methyltransferase domain-containing protein [Sanguibacter suaedae]|uniref:Class I SAM-dependent methyltransferase n=1 Tax=Sanguibacter suaedae TaxID=2795737 RepID=A0A934IBJ2_9MICO|nr:methyltransferase domain-containing protein [Sanguibacter suaedae]MBI9114765.1 class I SAM-dependent methyltransferase [Sanguibacter suaedae]
MTVYEAVVDPSDANLSHSLILEQVGRDKKVLDVGCASGYLAEALVARGCAVSGVEFDERAAEVARPHLERLVVDDLNTLVLSEVFAGEQFDVVVFGDILEHLQDPAGTLRSAVALLAPGGSIVISIPNVAHGSLRLALLGGEWNPTDRGLLDATHIRFFTYTTLVSMVEGAGLQVDEARSTVADALATEVAVPTGMLPPEIVDWVRRRPLADAYQFVIRASVVPADGVPAGAPRVRPAIEPPVVNDHFHQQAALVREEKQRMLTIRDHIIGLEAEAGVTRRRMTQLEEENRELRGELLQVAQDRAEIYRSSTWRIGKAAISPATIVKKVLGR